MKKSIGQKIGEFLGYSVVAILGLLTITWGFYLLALSVKFVINAIR